MKGIWYYFNNENNNIEIKTCINSVHSSRAHFHNEVSIALVESGTSKTEIHDEIYEITGKTFLLIPAGIVHKCNPDNYNDWNFRMIYISPEWFQAAFNIESQEIEFSCMQLNICEYLRIIKILNRVEDNIIDVEMESQLLNHIALLMDSSKTNKAIAKITSLEHMSRIKEFLDNNYLNNIMLDDLVKISGISKYYLIRQFENCYGLSPHKYITNLRINHSKELLKTSKDFIDISLESGFYDQSHFTKCFKEYTGVTPKKYKGRFII